MEKAWGREEVIVNRPAYCGKILHLRAGAQSSLHYHAAKEETFYLLSGRVELTLAGERGDRVMRLEPGDAVDIAALVPHRFKGLKDSRIIEFSTHHSDDDVFRLEESRKGLSDSAAA